MDTCMDGRRDRRKRVWTCVDGGVRIRVDTYVDMCKCVRVWVNTFAEVCGEEVVGARGCVGGCVGRDV